MISYKLAKQLKDAHFHQPKQGLHYVPVIEGDADICDGKLNRSLDAYIPSLSELIQACGKKFYALEFLVKESGNLKDIWLAVGQGNTPQLLGSCPEEAVAKLWLLLATK